MIAQDRGLGSWITSRRARSPEATAIVFGDQTISYRELADRADRVADALADAGITRGERVAYLGENHPAFVEVLLGCALVGAVMVPLNTRLAPREIAYVLRDAGARLLIHEAELAAVVPDDGVENRLPAVVLGGGERNTDYEQWLRDAPSGGIRQAMSLDDPAVILCTSGTTGRPKGAVLTHGNLTWNALNALVDVDVTSADVGLLISPLFHAASLGLGLLVMLLKGATVVLERQFDAGRALALIEKHRVTMLTGVPTTFQFLAEHPDWHDTDLSSVTKMICGGSPVTTHVIEMFEARGVSFTQGYGMTEASPGATILPATMTRSKMGSVGLPHFFTEIRVVAAEGQLAPSGDIGEIQVRGPNVSSGYQTQHEATAESFTPDGWLRTGDLGYLDDEGYLFVRDRLKDMIISGGENIFPVEVEELILQIPDVTGAAVIGVPDAKWGETPWAIVTLREGATLEIAQLKDHLTGSIARFKIPKNLVVLDELPRTASGKVRKNELRTRFGG
ncbi:MAG TPA: o-succinylbenzoate--CoA ligase [Pseudolysinimonas sp.]|nr:o-succinylbenzoate--CoA ligase [Pseudolysinimonas sp.]